MNESVDRPELEREVEEELRLAVSSHPEEVMDLPVTQWRFDPSEVEEYEAVLRGILGAAQNLDSTADGQHSDP